MNLLNDINLGDPVYTKKLSIQGQTKTFDVYRVPIEYLIYNKKNGRIATYVSQFIDEGKEFPENNIEFNNIIERYIELSNPNALKKTKDNIKRMSQAEPAVIMSNGIVLDGNRRFTSLRQLTREGAGAEFSYLDAVILESDTYSEKDIKRLELNLQHAIESKVDYNPIDLLVDIYRDLIEDGGTFTPEEYARETQMTLSNLNEKIEMAKLMLEYLEYIGQPKKFYIARQQKIDGPIREVVIMLRSKKIDNTKVDDIKEFLFLSILSLEGDVSRKIRDLKPVFEDRDLGNALIDEVDASHVFDDANDFFESENTKKEVSETSNLNLAENIKNQVMGITESYVETKKLSKAKNKPIVILNKVNSLLKDVDIDSVIRLNEELREEFNQILNSVEKQLRELGKN